MGEIFSKEKPAIDPEFKGEQHTSVQTGQITEAEKTTCSENEEQLIQTATREHEGNVCDRCATLEAAVHKITDLRELLYEREQLIVRTLRSVHELRLENSTLRSDLIDREKESRECRALIDPLLREALQPAAGSNSTPKRYNFLSRLFNGRKSEDKSEAKTLRESIEKSGLFDVEYYLKENADVVASGVDPLTHFIEFGARELRNPNPYFDVKSYFLNNPEIRRRRVNPLWHYGEHGWKEGRLPHPNFDPEWYLTQYPDIRDARMEPLHHFLRYGSLEGRLPCPSEAKRPYGKISPDQELLQEAILGVSKDLRLFRIAVGIVTYNNEFKELSRCVRSAKIACQAVEPSCVNHAIFLIDNGRPSEDALYENGEAVRFKSQGNIGFGMAHNLLMAKAFEQGFDYYVATNPDGLFHPSCIEALTAMSQAADDRAIIEAVQFPEEHPKIYDPVTFDTAWASGACMLIPRKIHREIGGFDELFFMYCEDVDLSWRARKSGFEVKTCPKAHFFHPVIERPFNLEIHKRYLSSGILLARKWGGGILEHSLNAEAVKCGIDLKTLPEVRAVESMGIADFDHQFSFSETRW